jgi:two-component system cell cycle response regulator DivK
MGAKILVVEDNSSDLELMQYLLRAFGHVTLAARDGAAGVQRAREEHPDLILMDLQLPGMDGFEAARLIKEASELKKIPIVAVTASNSIGDRNRVLGRGFDGYIAKPITAETFVAQVESFLRPPGS